jgi:hypothetical protein
VAEALDELASRLRRSLAEGSLHFRRHLVCGYDPETDARYAELVDEVVGADLGSG